MLGADTLVAHRDAEQVGESEDSCADRYGIRSGKSECRQFFRLNREHGKFTLWIHPQQRGSVSSAVIEHAVEFVGIKHGAHHGDDMPGRGDEDARLIGLQSTHTAGAVNLDHLSRRASDRLLR